MKAIKLFQSCEGLDTSERYIAALIILQSKAWAYYNVFVNTEIVWTRQIETAGTDGAYIYINPDFFLSFATDGNRAFLLAHEVGHIVLRHQSRGLFYKKRGFHSIVNGEKIPFSSIQWNVAADYVINADLVAHGLEFPGEGLLSDEFSRDDLVDNVYVTLMQKQQQQDDPHEFDSPDESDDSQANESVSDDSQDDTDDQSTASEDDESDESESGDEQSDGEDESGDESESGDNAEDGDEQSDGEPVPSDHGGIDDHFDPQYEGNEEQQQQAMDDDKAEIERKIDDALDALEDAKERGERHPPAADGFADGGYRHTKHGNASSTDWTAEFADLIHRSGKDGDVTWARINRRRYAMYGVISPTRMGTLDRIGFTVDMSGSVDRDMLHKAMIELAAAIDHLQPTSGCLVMFTNTEVVQVNEVMSGSELLDLEIPRYGGTEMSAACRYLEENGLDCDVHIIFTDGEMSREDYRDCAKAGAVLVLDHHPCAYFSRIIKDSGIRVIVASDEVLAA